MIVKIHEDQQRIIIALCDKDIFGRKFEEKNIVLDLSSEFFNGSEMKTEEIKDLIKKAYIVNAAGKRSIDLLKNLNLIDEKSIILVSNIPTVQVYKL